VKGEALRNWIGIIYRRANKKPVILPLGSVRSFSCSSTIQPAQIQLAPQCMSNGTSHNGHRRCTIKKGPGQLGGQILGGVSAHYSFEFIFHGSFIIWYLAHDSKRDVNKTII